MPITLRQLEVFTTVATAGSVTAAADKLHISQSSISHHLVSLEKEIGRQLYRSIGTGTELTAAGMSLFKRASRIIERIENARIEVHGKFAEQPQTGFLTIGASYTAATTYLLSLFRYFQHDHPAVQFRLRTTNGWILARLILNGEVDLALVRHRPTHKQLEAELFSTDPVTAFVAPDHPLARRKQPSWEELNNAGFIITNSPSKLGISARFVDYLKRKRLKPNVVLRCDSQETKNAAVKSLLGIGIGFKGAIEKEIEAGELIEVPLPGLRLSGNSYMIYHRKRALSETGLEFVAMLRGYRSELLQR